MFLISLILIISEQFLQLQPLAAELHNMKFILLSSFIAIFCITKFALLQDIPS